MSVSVQSPGWARGALCYVKGWLLTVLGSHTRELELQLELQPLTKEPALNSFPTKEIFEGHVVKPPYHRQGHLHLDQVAQNPVPHDLEHFHGWDVHHYSGILSE